MSERIKGFTIELDLDSIQVDSGLKDMRASMRQMNSEMRRNMSAFDYGERSLEKYGTQLDGLNKKLELQEKATESARIHYEKMVEEHGEGSRKAQEAAANYNHEAASLNNLERHIGKVTSEMQAFKREQEVQSSVMWKTGDALEGFGKGLGKVSSKAREVGGNLTKWITIPATGVITAAGGITAAFGWDRLVGLDSAQAQLQGLGYDTEAVGRISDQVTSAIEGGMTTMAEGTAVAAGAMAAGVEEGEELERYIKLVGDAAVGANRPVSDMAQIFNRVQGQGKLMTQELNMIEEGMPGFAQAMSDELADGSLEAFREMVTNGEVGSEEFLNVMENFAGGMAEAYSESWSGMLANTKAYIGMIGENLLGGVFEESKESLAEFIEILSSDEVMTWAEEMGQKIGEAFTMIVDSVKSGIEWFSNLSDSQQKTITKFGALVIAAGPLITGLGILGGVISKISSGLGVFLKFIAPITKGFGLFSGTAGKAGKTVGLLSRAFTFLTGPVGIVIGIISLLVAGFTTAYKRSETFRDFIHNLGEKLKEVFLGIVDWIRPGFDAVMDFFASIKEKFTEFWSTDGQQFIQAWKNIGSFLGTVLGGIWEGVKWAFEQIKWIIVDYVMPVVEFIIKQVWGNIKGIITGALDVIMGAVKTFSGLFTGDFSKMWEGIKQMFSGAIKVIWNWIQLQFIGRIIKGIGGFAKSFGGHIKSLWSGAKSLFSDGIKTVWNWMKNSFVGRIISSVINFVKNFRTNISTLWTNVKKLFKDRINEVFNNLKNSFVGRIIKNITNFAKNFRTNLSNMWQRVRRLFNDRINTVRNLVSNSFVGRIIKNITNFAKNFRTNLSDMWQRVRNLFTNRINSIRNSISNSFVGRMLSSVRNLKTNFINLAKDMWSGVKKQFTNIVNGAKGLPKRIGDGIKNAKNKAISGMKSVGNSLIKWAGKPYNKVIGGVNWITGKLGIKKKIGKWNWQGAQYAHGTDGHPGGPAILGDGKGSNAGREFVGLPSGESFLSADKPTLYPDLPKGTQVLSAKMTKQLPMYADGKGWLSKAWGGVKNFTGKIGKAVGDVWDYISNPKKLVNKVMDGIGVIKDKAQVPTKLVSAGFNYLKNKPVEFIKDMFSKAEEEGANAPAGGGAKAWRPNIKRASQRMNAGATSAEINGVIAQIHRESGGNQKITQSSAVVDINTLMGNPARGLLQYIPQSFNAFKMKGHGNIYSGYDQLLAFFNNSNWRKDLPYGTRGWGPTGSRRFGTGGHIKSKMMAMLGEEGEEMVIPLAKNRRTDAMKLLALTAKKLGVDDGNFARPSGMTGNDDSDGSGNELKQMLRLLMEQNDHLKKSNDLLTSLLGKDLDLYKLNKKVDEGLNNLGDRRRKAFGG